MNVYLRVEIFLHSEYLVSVQDGYGSFEGKKKVFVGTGKYP